MHRLVAIREAYPGILPMKEMMHLCFEATAPEFKRAIRNLKKKSDEKTK